MTIASRVTVLISTLAALSCLASLASAQSRTPATPTCPARYEPMAGFCFDATTGDIVLAEVVAAAPIQSKAQCKAGYEIMINALCMSHKTGDVVYADIVQSVATANK